MPSRSRPPGVDLLDPKLDVVFKMLFAEPRNRRLLVSLLAAVLRPPSPIVDATVLDPELPKDIAMDRGVRLDVLVQLQDGTRIDVEMECDPRRARGDRWLYHWARLFGDRLRRGDEYEDLEPVVCIVFLGCRTEGSRFHAVYELREVHDLSPLTDALRLHLVHLPRLEQAPVEGEDRRLERWARFLRFDGPEALDSLAKEDPVMAEAKSALEILSLEPSAKRLAEMRREAEIERRLDRAQDRAEGRAEGIAEGEARAVLAFLAARGIAVSEEQRRQIASCADANLLARWITRAATASSAAEVLAEA